VTEPALPPRIVLYDGVCGLCSATVKFLIKRDHGKVLMFAPLQGETAERLRKLHPRIPEKLDTVVLIDEGRVFLRSKAFFYVSRYLTRPWRWGYHLRWMPAFLLDLGYRLIARVRYRLWGKKESCEIPAPDERARFMA
jgi:predicted DCC family thiol-disulfide oxidoreductase YuxK